MRLSEVLQGGDEFYAICNCCRCCCVPLRLRRDYKLRNTWVRGKGVLGVARL